MKPKSSTASSSKAKSKSKSKTGSFQDDKQALVPDEPEGSVEAELPETVSIASKESYYGDNKLHPRRKHSPSFVSLCLYFSVFSLGAFTTLFATSFQTDFLKWYFNCAELKAGTDKDITPQAVLNGDPIDFLMFAPTVSSAACTDSCT